MSTNEINNKENDPMLGLRTSDYYFDLPQELIAQDPLEDRAASKLLVMDKKTGEIQHHVNSLQLFLFPQAALDIVVIVSVV